MLVVQPAPYLFLSYASVERQQALRIADLLEQQGISVWLDRRRITGATSWSAEIVRGLEGCAALVLLCSPAAFASRNVQQEVQLAWEKDRALLPLLLASAKPPPSMEYPLAGRQWVELLQRADDAWLPDALRA
ncbi:MAG TPA: toll/interleukin-1 receptor domain-containing protein, partial [Chloroflexota bacterium]